MSLNALLVEALAPPNDGSAPIRWLLLTSLPIETLTWIAQLGGFLARPGDGEPGLKTF